MWYVYILRCSDGTLYTGCTSDLDDRLQTLKVPLKSWFKKAQLARIGSQYHSYIKDFAYLKFLF